jgi:hypothetical protein
MNTNSATEELIKKLEKKIIEHSNLIEQLQSNQKKLEEQNRQLQETIQNFVTPISPLQSDQDKFKNFIAGNYLQLEEWIGKKKWQLLYKATRDGFRASDFHSKCDNKGPTVVIITSGNGCIFGGYTPLSWTSPSTPERCLDFSDKSFIFALKNFSSEKPLKFGLEKDGIAIVCNQNSGPVFGGGLRTKSGGSCDISVCDESDHKDSSHFGFPSSYGGYDYLKGNKVFTGSERFRTKEIEVFQVSD